MAADLGQNSHRLSLEWSRIEPLPGQWDESALLRYREILSFIRERGMTPDGHFVAFHCASVVL